MAGPLWLFHSEMRDNSGEASVAQAWWVCCETAGLTMACMGLSLVSESSLEHFIDTPGLPDSTSSTCVCSVARDTAV